MEDQSSATLNPATIWIINAWETQFGNLFPVKTSHCFDQTLFSHQVLPTRSLLAHTVGSFPGVDQVLVSSYR